MAVLLTTDCHPHCEPVCAVCLGTLRCLSGESTQLFPAERLCCFSPQDYELFVEAVEQNTLQEFLKLA